MKGDKMMVKELLDDYKNIVGKNAVTYSYLQDALYDEYMEIVLTDEKWNKELMKLGKKYQVYYDENDKNFDHNNEFDINYQMLHKINEKLEALMEKAISLLAFMHEANEITENWRVIGYWMDDYVKNPPRYIKIGFCQLNGTKFDVYFFPSELKFRIGKNENYHAFNRTYDLFINYILEGDDIEIGFDKEALKTYLYLYFGKDYQEDIDYHNMFIEQNSNLKG